MSEQRLIDAECLKKSLDDIECSGGNKFYLTGVNDAIHRLFPQIIDDVITFDPETLPIVRELREKLSRYEQEEQKGRLVNLPCKVGTHLFVTRQDTNIVYEAEMVGFWIRELGESMRLFIFDDNRFTTTPIENYGKTVFLTREEAEAALKERENDGL